MPDDKPLVEPPVPSNWWWMLAAGLVLVGWLSNLFILKGVDDRGTLGDMFGASNAAFSGFALVGVVFAIAQQFYGNRLQRHEIAISRADLEKTKQILADQERALKEQLEQARRGAFEATFFHMIGLINARSSALTGTDGNGRPIVGRRVLARAADLFQRSFIKNSSLERDQRIRAAYMISYHQCGPDLSVYAETVISTIILIKNHGVTKGDVYALVMKSQLHYYDLFFLMNHIELNKSDLTKDLADEYDLFKGLDETDLS